MLRLPLIMNSEHQRRVRIAVGIALALIVTGSALFLSIVYAKFYVIQAIQKEAADTTYTVTPFPISVDPIAKRIDFDPTREQYIESYSTQYLTIQSSGRWFDEIVSRLSTVAWYQNLATPQTRVLIILPGERKEQVIRHFSQILRWDNEQTNTFTELIERTPPAFIDGTLFPGRYILAVDTTPEAAFAAIHSRFQNEIVIRYPDAYEQIVPLHDALIIASLLEREAYDFSDMRIISGVIWNRLFIDMPLQLDASLQYARLETEPWLSNWWPVPRPADKFINSPYNTYLNKGLPPSPIANPRAASVIAALNPKETDCLFYFHDRRAGFHCSETYEEHVEKLVEHYGRGR